MADSERRAGTVEEVFRRANLALEAQYRALPAEARRDLEPAPFLCECANPRCTAVVQLTLEEFAAVRRHARRFVVVPGHAVAGATLVVEETDRFAIVERNGVADPVRWPETW